MIVGLFATKYVAVEQAVHELNASGAVAGSSDFNNYYIVD
jgi:hypothetical protein